MMPAKLSRLSHSLALAAALLLALSLQAQAQTGRGSDTINLSILKGNLDAPATVELLGETLRKDVILAPNLPNISINFESNREVSEEEFVRLVETLLAVNGVAVIDIGDAYIKAVPLSEANRQVPNLLTMPARDLEPSQEVFATFIKLDYLETEQAQEVLSTVLSATGAASTVVLEKQDWLLVTDYLVNLQRAEEILAEIDKPAPIKESIEFIELQNTSAPDLQRRLDGLRTGSLSQYLEGSTTFDSDERTNQLIVITHPGNLPLIRNLVENLDKDVAPRTRSEVFTIQHAEAVEVGDLLQAIISGQQQTRERDTPATAGRQQPAAPNQTAAQRRAEAIRQAQQQGQNPAASATADNLEGTGNLQFSEFVGIVADERSNSIVAFGTDTDLAFISALIEEIDVLLAQVRIEVIIAEVNLTKDTSRGIDRFGVNWNSPEGTSGPSSGGGTLSVDGGEDDIGFVLPGSGFGLDGVIRSTSLNFVVESARSDSNVQILSAPTMVTTHNREASINVGEQRPVITQSLTDTTGDSSIRSNVDFRDIGIELTVKPLIGSNGIVQLEITQTVESVTDTVEIDGNVQPIIGTREATSFISVRDREVVVLGGLQQTDRSLSESRLPLLGDIPLLGMPFRRTTENVSNTELLIFIRPYVLYNTDDASRLTERSLEGFEGRRGVEEYLDAGLFPKPDLRPSVRDAYLYEDEDDAE